MAKKQTAPSIANLNVVAGCIIRVIDEKSQDDWEAPIKWITLGETAYTPKHINDVLKAANVDCAWVNWMCGKELWYRGERLAIVSHEYNKMSKAARKRASK